MRRQKRAGTASRTGTATDPPTPGSGVPTHLFWPQGLKVSNKYLSTFSVTNITVIRLGLNRKTVDIICMSSKGFKPKNCSRRYEFSICILLYRVFIKYCVFSKDIRILRTLVFLCFFGVSVYTQTRQVEHQCCSRTGRIQKIHKILRKNTIFIEHPVGL